MTSVVDRRAFVGTVALGLLAPPLAAEAQQAGKVYRIGVLGLTAADPIEARQWQAFRLGLRERGWIEGGNILIESRWAEGNLARVPELAADLVRLKVDVIVTRGSPFVQGARKATSSIPIVFTQHADPVRSGHVVSLAKPGGNITGLAQQMTELYVKALELSISAIPGAKRIAVLWNPDAPSHPPGLKALEEAARPLQLQLQPVVARTGADFESAFAAMARAHAQALLVLATGPYTAESRRLAELAIRYRLPTFFVHREHVETGGLLSYGPDVSDLVRRGAIYVDKILRGTKPGELPVEQASKFELVLNLKTAKALGLTIPQSLLVRADQVID
jgi:putative tryptophan/tyrosine transport system substrate-binding protein